MKKLKNFGKNAEQYSRHLYCHILVSDDQLKVLILVEILFVFLFSDFQQFFLRRPHEPAIFVNLIYMKGVDDIRKNVSKSVNSKCQTANDLH